jgi:hypothetical protein
VRVKINNNNILCIDSTKSNREEWNECTFVQLVEYLTARKDKLIVMKHVFNYQPSKHSMLSTSRAEEFRCILNLE